MTSSCGDGCEIGSSNISETQMPSNSRCSGPPWASKERSEAVYPDAIRGLCESGKHCYLHFCSDKRFVPLRLPMSDAEADAETASYTRNPKTNFEQFLWSCRLNSDRNKCFQ
jgi:hypothetical protein